MTGSFLKEDRERDHDTSERGEEEKKPITASYPRREKK